MLKSLLLLSLGLFVGLQLIACTTANSQPKVSGEGGIITDANLKVLIDEIKDVNNLGKLTGRDLISEHLVGGTFIHDGKTYKVNKSPYQNSEVVVTFTVRKNNSEKDYYTITANRHGRVISGTDNTNDKVLFDENPYFTRGLDNRKLWQNKFETTIQESLAYFNKTYLLTNKDI